MVWPGLTKVFALPILKVRYLAVFSFSLTKFTKEPGEDVSLNPMGSVNENKT